jgi:Fur family transcriptional regulator, ferric uptake regulator
MTKTGKWCYNNDNNLSSSGSRLMVRNTQQGGAIRQALKKAGRPLSAQEILSLAQKKVPGLGIATVYRNLKSLQEDGFVVAVELPGQPPRWELAPDKHHHHFLCNTCDKLFEINACPEDLQRLLPAGYTMEEHDILLRGLCDNCSRKNKTT